ncbi:hypothetical protein BBF96_09445 [Anoxybacter fermentans]|uniref:Restriction endonuclease type IV Mrr domain-containing protein n=1 Tax=Anoxybacter fermentans TaxID=1323375 RepID=A0A3Q9HQW8_9FIRM|nr:hypothetical protein [Anoxybacter fermentans]AZR73593.1 hypothetical protein BBF96_09445 [Anoxybacter fermentans]
MNKVEEYTIFAVKTIQPWEEGSEYWIPRIYEELKKGKARFGWSYFVEADLRKIKAKIDKNGWNSLSDKEKDSWKHAHFMLSYVKPGDYFVYINMPEYGKCTIVKITGEYIFSEIWDDGEEGDFRHFLPCEFVAYFDRNSNIVHPYLRRRLGLRGAWWRVYAKQEFEELLQEIKEGGHGKDVKERFEEEMNSYLDEISKKLHHIFPGKNLEDLLIGVLGKLPNVKEVRKGPDVNGADLEFVYESGFEIEGLQKEGLCAVQVKSYGGKMGYTKAIEDIRRAFDSNPDYTCGLIISTALKMTEEFEEELEKLRNDTGKNVGILLGKDLASLIVKYGIHN